MYTVIAIYKFYIIIDYLAKDRWQNQLFYELLLQDFF